MVQIKTMENQNPKSYAPQEHSSMVHAIEIHEPLKKKPKSFGEDFETGNASAAVDDETDDALNKYLELRINMQLIDDYPLMF